jgi:hypothetical protein
MEGAKTPKVVVNTGEEGTEGLFSTYLIYKYIFIYNLYIKEL